MNQKWWSTRTWCTWRKWAISITFTRIMCVIRRMCGWRCRKRVRSSFRLIIIYKLIKIINTSTMIIPTYFKRLSTQMVAFTQMCTNLSTNSVLSPQNVSVKFLEIFPAKSRIKSCPAGVVLFWRQTAPMFSPLTWSPDVCDA